MSRSTLNDSQMSGIRKSVVLPTLNSFVEKKDKHMCEEHNEIKNNFAVENFDKYKKGEAFCSVCTEELNEKYQEKHGESAPIKAYHLIIKKQKEKILEIKRKNIDEIAKGLSAANSIDSQNSQKIFKEKITSIPDTVSNLIEQVEDGVYSRISNEESLSNFREIKQFIDNMQLSPNGDPILEKIGAHEGLKVEYAKLAQFLLTFEGVEIKGDYEGIVENFKQTIVTLNDTRKSSVQRMDLLMKSFLGPMFDHIYSLEGMKPDEEFRSRFLPEYINEDYVNKLKAEFRAEIKTKDDRIAELEALLKKQKAEIAQLNSLNGEYKIQIEKMSADMILMKTEFEKKIRNALQAMKTECDKKVKEVTDEMNDWKQKYLDLEAKSKDMITKLNLEIKTLTTNFKNKIADLEKEIQSLNDQLAELTNSSNKKIKALNAELNELRKKYTALETEYHTKMEQMTNEIKALHADYKGKIAVLEANIKKMTLEITHLNEEIESLRAQLSDANQKFNDLKTKLTAELNELKMRYASLENEYHDKVEQMANEIKGLHAEYKARISVLEANIKKMTLEITHLNEEITNLQAQLADANKRFNDLKAKLTAELNDLKNKYTALETEYHEKMEQNANEIKGLHADYKSKISVLEATIKKMTSEIAHLNEVNANLQAQLDDANKRLSDISKRSGDDITRLQTELRNLNEQLNSIIEDLRAKLNLANGKLEVITKERDELRVQIPLLHDEMEHQREILNTTENLLWSVERSFKTMVGDRDREINTLKATISMMKEDWERLSQAYELLDAEIKKQLCCNDELREVIRNLTCNNKDHNLKINELEAELKIIFEQFVKCALKKKTIDFEDPTKKVDQCEENSLKCKEIIAKMRNNKPAQSSSFSNIEITLETIKGGQTTFTDVKLPSSIKF